jgi:hypothetical protein
MVHDDPACLVHPAAGGDAEPHRRAAAGVLGEEAGNARGRPGKHSPRVGLQMRQPLAHDHAAAQVDKRERRGGERNMQAAGHQAAGVDVDGHVRAADRLGVGGLEALAQHSRGDQIRGKLAHGRRAEPGQPGDGTPGHGAVV